MKVVLLAFLIAGCVQTEDLGARLRRECESAWTQLEATYGVDMKAQWVAVCIDRRATGR